MIHAGVLATAAALIGVGIRCRMAETFLKGRGRKRDRKLAFLRGAIICEAALGATFLLLVGAFGHQGVGEVVRQVAFAAAGNLLGNLGGHLEWLESGLPGLWHPVVAYFV